MATKKKAKTKVIKQEVNGFTRIDLIKYPDCGSVQLLVQSMEHEGTAEFTLSNLDTRISMYGLVGNPQERKEFITTLETLVDHLLELKWHIEDNV